MINFKLNDVKALNIFLDKQIDIERFGNFSIGLSDEEINKYLQQRYNSYSEYMGSKLISKRELKSLRKKFNKIAGINTRGVIFINKMEIVLTYRCDVERFANVLFTGKLTYWD